MYSASNRRSGRSHWAKTRLSRGRNSSAPASSPVEMKKEGVQAASKTQELGFNPPPRQRPLLSPC